MRPTCRAFLAIASLVALPVSLARAGDPSPTPPQDPGAQKAEAFSVPGLPPEVSKAIDALFDAPAPAPAAQPMPTDVPILGTLFRGGGARPGGPGGGAPPLPPRGEAPRPPARTDARPADPRRAELERWIRKAIDDALAFRKAIGGRRHGEAGGGMRAPMAPGMAPVAPLAPMPPKPPKAAKPPPMGPQGSETCEREVIVLVSPEGRRVLAWPEGAAPAAGPHARGRAGEPKRVPPANAGDREPPSLLPPRGRLGEAGGPPPHAGRADGSPPPPPGIRHEAGPLERLLQEVRALRKEVRALRRQVAQMAADEDDDEDEEEGSGCGCGCACHDDGADRGFADRDERDDRGDRGRRGDRDRRDDPRPRRRPGRGPGPLFGAHDGPNDDGR